MSDLSLKPLIGRYENLEIIVYANRSVFAKNKFLTENPDATVARAIAVQELVDILSIAGDDNSNVRSGMDAGSEVSLQGNATEGGMGPFATDLHETS